MYSYVLEHRGQCYSKGEGIVISPFFTPVILKVHDVYIVINRGVELKEKSPPSIWSCYVSAIGIVANGMSCYTAHYSFGHHVNMHIN